MVTDENQNMQVTKKHFKDLASVRVEGESSRSQQLVVYTDSESDRDLLKVKYILSLRERSVDEITREF